MMRNSKFDPIARDVKNFTWGRRGRVASRSSSRLLGTECDFRSLKPARAGITFLAVQIGEGYSVVGSQKIGWSTYIQVYDNQKKKLVFKSSQLEQGVHEPHQQPCKDPRRD